ncbi:hypothetical protein [Tuwongella immobilis]|uniref:Uncharacterized protein n=1 Tax=Tuwongella immobilis TaxID=692036 RepID=A0A6C2YTB4_9BACT|nr:hypothetical protein [Tuwongella immobilis]VIP04363.1 unnamed protein product [Tuwongella immobilis]VTS06088.1 unnamed protein product [Tuwongella immobilis]
MKPFEFLVLHVQLSIHASGGNQSDDRLVRSVLAINNRFARVSSPANMAEEGAAWLDLLDAWQNHRHLRSYIAEHLAIFFLQDPGQQAAFMEQLAGVWMEGLALFQRSALRGEPCNAYSYPSDLFSDGTRPERIFESVRDLQQALSSNDPQDRIKAYAFLSIRPQFLASCRREFERVASQEADPILQYLSTKAKANVVD